MINLLVWQLKKKNEEPDNADFIKEAYRMVQDVIDAHTRGVNLRANILVGKD